MHTRYGSIEAAVTNVAAWLTDTVGEPVPIDMPRNDGDGLVLWPLELRSVLQTRGGTGRDPYRLVVRLLVCGTGTAALSRLDRVIAAAASAGEPEVRLTAGDPALWRVFGVAPRPAVLVDVPAQIARPQPPVPPVLEELRVRQVDMRTLAGRVVGPRQQPLAAVRVEIEATGQATYTDADGRFRLAGVPLDPDQPDRPVRIRLLCRGRVDVTELAPGKPEHVIVCQAPTH
ncbi:carboxypeptidase regulatory-like domain-containing protein [Micromonospora sp. WMMA1363]|uniref:carboxypeptidase regulatory-like domain-containing protein n=1 Tax=Micromonospora sp. WMMA1363 TaxID=3053985 RepID=UPI00259D2D26|nr:carboxypeptidase regulatory-like domain-containing protein [Micromonospora sp. WMMA1363]MDM4722265.1 carboxypeptidase regulatory-like domain-containing protein [Micromonospora sp. WMMA1363]